MARKTALLVLVATLVGFASRIVRLDYQTLRGDESFSIWFSAGNIENIFNLLAIQ